MLRLREFVDETRAVLKTGSIIVDGSFVTDIDEPNDIDLLVISDVSSPAKERLTPTEYNTLSRRRIARRFGFDVIVASPRSELFKETVALFGRVRGHRDRRKGMLRIQI